MPKYSKQHYEDIGELLGKSNASERDIGLWRAKFIRDSSRFDPNIFDKHIEEFRPKERKQTFPMQSGCDFIKNEIHNLQEEIATNDDYLKQFKMQQLREQMEEPNGEDIDIFGEFGKSMAHLNQLVAGKDALVVLLEDFENRGYCKRKNPKGAKYYSPIIRVH